MAYYIKRTNITEDTLIKELQREKLLSVRVGNSLMREGCKTIKDITNHTVYEISIMRNMGKKAYDEIIEFLKLNGFSPKQSKESEQKNE